MPLAGPRLTDDAFHDVGLSPAIVAVAIHDIDDRGAAAGIAFPQLVSWMVENAAWGT